MLSQLLTFLEQLINQLGPIGLMFAAAVESFFPPIPSEFFLVTAGLSSRAQGGLVYLLILCVAASIGNYLGTLPFYIVSRWGAETFLPKFLDKWGPFLLISNKDLARAHRLFERRGAKVVFFAKLIPGIRSLIAFPAGVSKMNFTIYSIYSLLGSLVWNLILGLIGYFAYDAKDAILELFSPFEKIILAVLIATVIFYILNIFYQIRKRRFSRSITS